jgi:hypothetical protein
MGYTNSMEPTEDNVRDSIINPFYAVSFADYLFQNQHIETAKEDWVLKNSQLIKEMGSPSWVEQLLVSLSTKQQDTPTYTVICPRNAVSLSTRLQGEHEPIVDSTTWVAANVKLIDELGTEKWLWQLLDVLETGGVAA